MILVTTGTHPQQFNRLLEEVDKLIDIKSIKENVVMQIGYSTYIPKNGRWFRFTSYGNMIKLLRKACIVITHGGIGSILLSIRLNKKTIVIPRLKKFGEHTNDHQLEIVKELSYQKRILPVYDIEKLHSILKKTKSFKPVKSNRTYKIQDMINQFLKQLE